MINYESRLSLKARNLITNRLSFNSLSTLLSLNYFSFCIFRTTDETQLGFSHFDALPLNILALTEFYYSVSTGYSRLKSFFRAFGLKLITLYV